MSGNETRKCANVTIIDDRIVEWEESFEVTITFPPGQPALQIGEIVPPAMQINVTVNIIDDDGELEEWNEDVHIIFVPFSHVQSNIYSFQGIVHEGYDDKFFCVQVCASVKASIMLSCLSALCRARGFCGI